MPIAFPQKPRGRPGIWAANLVIKPFDFVPAPNMGGPNFRFSKDTLGSGIGKLPLLAMAYNPGVNFAKAFLIHDIEPRAQFLTDARLRRENDGFLNMVMVGVSRDNAGVALGTCQVMLFRTEDRSFVAETVSDASGNWSLSVLKGGPFFIVYYKAGAPDRATSTLNTLVPAQV